MTGELATLLLQYGALLVGLTTFASCLALPVPSSLLMMTAGGFVASGDMTGWQVVTAAFLGAVLGDHAGYAVGRGGGALLIERIGRAPSRERVLGRARTLVHRYGLVGVFLSRWLVSPLGPYVNFLSGAARMRPTQFALAATTGEAIWVAVHVGFGYAFADRLVALVRLAGNLSGLLASAAVAAVLGLWLLHRVRRSARSA